MPGYTTHTFIQQLVAQQTGHAPLEEILSMMNDHPQDAALGSLGPDITFFLDLMPVAQLWLQRGIKVYEMMKAFIEPFEEALERLEETVDEAATDYVPGYSPVKQAFQEFEATMTYLEQGFKTALAAFASDYVDVYAYLKLPMQRGLREEGWYWFDMLHYRRTSRFAMNLLKVAREEADPRAIAYAAGYVTHLATDTVGHPFVNSCAGGPYRLQWQKHHCTDNYVDVWIMNKYLTKDINGSGWYVKYPEEFHAGIRSAFLKALKLTYGGIRHPDGRLLEGREYPSDADLRRMWKMLHMAIETQTTGGGLRPPEPPTYDIDFDSFPSPPQFEDYIGERRRGGFSWKALLESLISFVKDVFVYLHRLLVHVVNKVVEAGLMPLRYALYLIRMALYSIYRAYRRVMALRGYCFAHPDELIDGGRFSRRAYGTMSGTLVVSSDELSYDLEKNYYMAHACHDGRYPHTEGSVMTETLHKALKKRLEEADDSEKVLIEACLAAGGVPMAFQFPWRYPDTPEEKFGTFASPYGCGSTPDIFVDKARMDRRWYEALKRVDSVEKMVGVLENMRKSHTHSLGNAVDLSLVMLEDMVRGEKPPDFNLDGDRGYGWLCWDLRPLGAPKRKQAPFTYQDIVVGDQAGMGQPPFMELNPEMDLRLAPKVPKGIKHGIPLQLKRP